MGWLGLQWIGMELSRMAISVLAWNGMYWDGMVWDGTGWTWMEWNGMDWDGMGWDGMKWNGTEWNMTEQSRSDNIALDCSLVEWNGTEWNARSGIEVELYQLGLSQMNLHQTVLCLAILSCIDYNWSEVKWILSITWRAMKGDLRKIRLTRKACIAIHLGFSSFRFLSSAA